MGTENEPGSDLATYQDLDRELAKITWLWPQWIPNFGITLLVGDPGVGKSVLALWLARSVTNDSPWPNLMPSPGLGNVLWCESEGRHQMNVERARGFEINLKRLVLPFGKEDFLKSFRVDLVSHRKKLSRAVDLVEPRLIIIDALGAAHRGRENDAEIQGVLADLRDCVGDPPVPILILHHLRKSEQGGREEITLHDVRGSGALTAEAVSVISVEPHDPLNESSRRVQHLKSNAGILQNSLSFTWTGEGLAFGEIGGGEGKKSQRLDRDLLRELTEGKARPVRDVLDALDGESKRMVYLAASRLERRGLLKWVDKHKETAAFVKRSE